QRQSERSLTTQISAQIRDTCTNHPEPFHLLCIQTRTPQLTLCFISLFFMSFGCSFDAMGGKAAAVTLLFWIRCMC
ncbi:MAG: hypothetical protein LBJ71_04990, partial [Holosporaceae bacterium]|nr:hypothetical protein [Holosporaceae bacterium]